MLNGRGIRQVAAVCLLLALGACGSGGGGGGGGGGGATTTTVTTPTHTVGGTVTGLTGSGMALLLNNSETLGVNADGSFTFTSAVPQGGGYAVTVATQPSSPTQYCAVTNGIGMVAGADVTTVTVDCSGSTPPPPAYYTVSANVSGLLGSGLQLQLNGAEVLSPGADGLYPFTTLQPSGGGYIVTVLTQPAGPVQNCVVSGGLGVVGSANVLVTVTCNPENTYVVGGQVLGAVGSGLTIDLNGTETLANLADGLFTFTSPLAAGTGYAVTVTAQPSAPAQTCAVTNGSGTIAAANVSNVLVVCAPPASLTVGGTVAGLVGSGLQLSLNGGSPQAVGNNGAFTFTNPLPDGSAYAVTVAADPASPAQTCSVAGGGNGDGTGALAGASVTNVTVTCTPPASYLVGGAVTGLVGSGFQLLLNGTAVLPVGADGPFQFTSFPVVDAGNYVVTVQTQPGVPTQACVVTAGSGTVNGADVNSVVVTCNPAGSFTVGGTVSGLVGTGQGLQVHNGAETLDVGANGNFTFAAAVVDAGTYDVTVQTQPGTPAQSCSVSNGSGTIATANVTSVAVTCAAPAQYTIGGTVSGLTGSGLKLRLNGSIDLDVAADGGFAFGTSVVDNGAYSVAVQVQPTAPAEYCSVSGGSGTVAGANVGSVDVVCSAGFTVGGTLTGLQGGNSITLRNSGADPLTLGGDGGFTFANPVGVLQSYDVTISASPNTPPQQCSVTNGAGTIAIGNVTDVQVTCSAAAAYTIGGSVSGLAGTGLALLNNGGDRLPIAADGGFTFVAPLFDAAPYAVTVGTAPSAPSQTCMVTGGANGDGTGTVSGANVGSIAVSCATNAYTIGGSVSGLTGSVTLQNNGGNSLILSSTGAFSFTLPLADNSAYAVTVSSQPAGQFCTVSNGTGSLAGGNVTTVGVVCNTLYTVGGTVTGLAGTGLVLRNNGADDKPIAASGSFTFATTVADGGAYAVTVATSPSAPNQTCTVSGGANNDGSGTISGAAVSNIAVTCVTNTYTVGGTVTGLIGSDLIIRKNGASTLILGAQGPFTFAVPQADQTAYTVTKVADPSNPFQPCTVTNGSGTMAGANVTNVQIDCAVNPPTVAVPVGPMSVKPNFTPFTLDLSGTFTDTEDPPANLALSVESVNPAGVIDAAFDAGTHTLRLTYAYPGWYDGTPVTITVKATDSTLATVTNAFPVLVAPARYENGVDWNEYVINDGAGVYNATDAVCTGAETGGYGACLHGGEMRSMPVPGYAACTGLTGSDALDAFYWTCNVRGGQAYMETHALKPGRGLADLIDWSGTPAWLEDSLSVSDGVTTVYTSNSRVWWGNPVVEINAATPSGSLNAAGSISAVTARPTAGVDYTLAADEVALVVKPGLVLQGSGTASNLITATNRFFTWMEGAFNGAPPAGTANTNGLAWTNVKFSVARKVKYWNGVLAAGNIAGINVSGGGNNRLTEILVANVSGNATNRGILLQGSTTDNTLSDATVFNNQGTGIELLGASNNRLFDIVSFANGARGVYLPDNVAVNSNSNVLANVTVVNNASEGVYILGQSGANLANGNTLMNIAGANNTYGLRLSNTSNTYIENMAGVSNATRDVRLATANSTFDGVLKATNSTGTGCQVTASTGLTTTTCTATGAYGSTTPGGAVFHKIMVVTNTFRGVVTSDTVNVSEDVNGRSLYAVGMDWSSFENAFRGWGIFNAAAFPAAAHRGRCAAAATCQIWDWSLKAADLGDRGPNGVAGGGDDLPVLLNTVTVPTGADAVTHTWVGGATVTLLLNAVEQRDAATGDNDGLCESGETCLYTPNMGAYQGHGTLGSAGTIGAGGTVQNVNLIQYGTNGY